MAAREILDAGLIEAHLQPVVDLATGAVVGHEALARGPRGHALERPDHLFAAARAEGLLAETDAACVQAALEAATAAGCTTLFVNVECSVLDGPPAELPAGVRGILEVTERDIIDRPAELLVFLDRARDAGWGVAVDDIGAEWGSLALLPLLRPDIVKLDRGVLSEDATRETAGVVRAARAYVDRSGAVLLAEGIEDLAHEQRAMGFGATLGQGWHFGRPLPAGEAAPVTAPIPVSTTVAPDPAGTPFELLLQSGLPRGIATKRELLPFSEDLELESHGTRDPMVLLGTFQTADRFTPRTRRRYADLAAGSALVAVFGVDVEDLPVPGVRGASLDEHEALAGEWIVITVGPHQAAALVARDLGDTEVRDGERRFEYALLTDRTLIETCARSLLRRVAAVSSPTPSSPPSGA